MSEGLFDDDAGALGAARLGELLHHHPEQQGRDGEVVRRPLRGTEFSADGLKRCRVVVVAVDVAQQAAQFVKRRGINSPVFLQAVAGPRRSWSMVQPDLATPMTGTFRWPRFNIA